MLMSSFGWQSFVPAISFALLAMTSLAFMPLGLPATHPFWADAAQPWTQIKAWGGQPFPKDHRWADDITTKDKW